MKIKQWLSKNNKGLLCCVRNNLFKCVVDISILISPAFNRRELQAKRKSFALKHKYIMEMFFLRIDVNRLKGATVSSGDVFFLTRTTRNVFPQNVVKVFSDEVWDGDARGGKKNKPFRTCFRVIQRDLSPFKS